MTKFDELGILLSSQSLFCKKAGEIFINYKSSAKTEPNKILEWFKEYFGKEISEGELKPVSYFTLLWNLFEYTYFSDENRLNNEKLLELAQKSINHIPNDSLQEIYHYFQNRYFPNEMESSKFKQLRLDKRLNKGVSYFEFCRKVLVGTESEKIDKLKCILLIIYRFRNNLFHGKKQPTMLHTYQGPFNTINKFLMVFIKNYSV